MWRAWKPEDALLLSGRPWAVPTVWHFTQSVITLMLPVVPQTGVV